MIKAFSLNRNNVIMNFSLKYCEDEKQLLESIGFGIIFNDYLNELKSNNNELYSYFNNFYEYDEISKNLVNLFKLLLVLKKEDIIQQDKNYEIILNNQKNIVSLIEGVYNHWRKKDRYAIIQHYKHTNGIQNVNFIDAIDNFTNLVLKVYRKIEESILGTQHNVYRQLRAGVNAGIVLTGSGWEPIDKYQKLNRIAFIESIVLNPPIITYPKRTKRVGFFNEVLENPLSNLKITKNHWVCYPAKVGEYLAYIYFHRDFLTQGIALCNLFELAKREEYENRKPDLIYTFGVKDNHKEMYTAFYHDKENDIMIGYANRNEDLDYFGYMKKMLLTLHNVRQIENRNLPIHGAMVNVTLKNNKQANIVIVGDSGAGKSESLEAFRKIGSDYLKDMKIIFDDMGVFKIEDNQVIGYGTEIGAFVRLDDLDIGYAYNEMDRSILMNPDKTNARLVMPVSTYEDIIKGHKVDILLYANNYEEKDDKLSFFKTSFDAINIYKKGFRKAKGTTSETGIVSSYFANPFGPHQRQEQSDVLLEQFFNQLFDNKIPVGEIYTQLAICNMEQKGPEEAAVELFNFIKKL